MILPLFFKLAIELELNFFSLAAIHIFFYADFLVSHAGFSYPGV